jgi:regulator of protease activity HflC (stomatin/prohibitin superfamily)
LRSVLGQKDLDDMLTDRESINEELQTIIDQQADRLESPTALQLRLFQTLTEISSGNSSTVILPVPIDLFRPYLEASNDSGDGHA